MSYHSPEPWGRAGDRPASALEEFPPDLTFPQGHRLEGALPVPAQAPRRPRARWIAGFSGFVALVVGMTTYILVRDWTHGLFERLDTAAHTSVVTPDKLGTQPKATEAELKVIVAGLTEAYAKEKAVAKATSKVIAAYGSTARNDAVVVMAFAGRVVSPDKELDGFMRGISDGEVVLYTDLDPGPLGGVARCGTMTKTFAAASAVCAWVDHGSLGGLVFLGQPLTDKIKKRFLDARPQIEKVEAA
ncbi:hypothetical protein Cs7R123_02870 [Catellatospora sp. TT07R-123]|uniref:hypothetical protein n=1 Tax=Catellatospora sp. TT07R-123 TaxID=2733863 RepID=UPI001B10B4BC|nr:hypothetical protein [Catellatospora sp. TT07R-123]GHJ42945.1 hypothetical protein Cs7R123_02870 [Catellatospora sp. TT07R-123]